MIRLLDFESNLIKLAWVWYRLMAIYTEFPNIQGSHQNAKLFRSVIREMTIIQLDNFLTVRNSLLKDPDFRKVDACLKLLCSPIVDVKTPIRLIRNNYVAHIQDKKKPFELMIQDIIDKYHLPTSWGYWIMLAGCSMFYCGIIEANFTKEWDGAQKKYDALSPVLTKYGTIGMGNYKKETSKILKEVHRQLQMSGYKIYR